MRGTLLAQTEARSKHLLAQCLSQSSNSEELTMLFAGSGQLVESQAYQKLRHAQGKKTGDRMQPNVEKFRDTWSNTVSYL